MKWFVKCLRNYVNFRGRATRREFWYFVLFQIIFVAFAGLFDYLIGFILGGSGLQVHYAVLAVMFLLYLPKLAVMTRRLHDTGRSGWWTAGYVAVSAASRFIGSTTGAEDSSTLETIVVLIGGIYMIFLLFCLLAAGDAGENDYGADPRDDAQEPSRP